MSLVAASTWTSVSRAQTADSREVASHAPTNYETVQVWETHVAIDADRAVAVFNVHRRTSSETRVGYAILEQGNWSEGIIPMGDFTRSIDGTVASDSQTGNFVAAGFPGNASGGHIAVAIWDVQQRQWNPWESVWQSGVDKPWIVAGEVLDGEQEFYILFADNYQGQGPGYSYARSRDGGDTWTAAPITIDGQRITSTGASPSAHPTPQGSDVYAVVMHEDDGEEGMTLRFIHGVDDDSPQGAGAVVWDWLTTALDEPPWMGPGVIVPLEVRLNRGEVTHFLPGGVAGGLFPNGLRTNAQLAADPTDQDRLYLVYQDTTSPTSKDVNVYVRVLVRLGDQWSGAGPIKVNDDDTDYESDQFLPSIIVDSQGRLHVVFYDDRWYTDPQQGQPDEDQQPDSTEDARYDAFYAFAEAGIPGGTFTNVWLHDNDPICQDPEAALDGAVANDATFEPGEYIGVAYSAVLDEARAVYTGTLTCESAPQNAHKSVIYSSRIHSFP